MNPLDELPDVTPSTPRWEVVLTCRERELMELGYRLECTCEDDSAGPGELAIMAYLCLFRPKTLATFRVARDDAVIHLNLSDLMPETEARFLIERGRRGHEPAMDAAWRVFWGMWDAMSPTKDGERRVGAKGFMVMRYARIAFCSGWWGCVRNKGG